MSLPRQPPPKPALTLDQQVALLRHRGMQLDDEAQARAALGHLNYYRLRGYWLPFEMPAVQGEPFFHDGTRFDAVLALYDFDRRLRLEAYDAIERVEVALRTRWAYVLGLKAGPTAHRDPSLFNAQHVALLAKVEDLYRHTKEVFLLRYLRRNEEPPIWALCEVLSIGDLSKWLSSLKQHADREAIANAFDLREAPFVSFVQHLTLVRNICAHHARLWNRQLVISRPQLPRYPTDLAAQLQYAPERRQRIYNTLTILAFLLRTISPASVWSQRLRALVEERPDLWDGMGFPADWQSHDLWKECKA